MTSDRRRRLRHRLLLAIAVVLAAPLPSCADAAVGEDARITVMTQNLYLGTPLNAAFGASSWTEFVTAGSQAWSNLLAGDIPTRAGALADAIAEARPDVVGLQEVALWRDQTPSDVMTQPTPNAMDVSIDFLAILRGELNARGVPYAPVATSTNIDVEFPRSDPVAGLVDLRLTDRDVLMVRADLADRFSNPMDGHYAAQFGEPFPTGPVTSTRGWTSIDYRIDRTTTTRIFNTHLEVGGPVTGTIQERQGDEFLALVAGSPHPAVALGDFNSPPEGSSTRTYRNLTAVLHDAWASDRPGNPGWTCCQPLADPVGRASSRVDLVLVPEDWAVTRVALIGDQPFRAAPPPLWASDHFGVTARVVVHEP